MGNFNYKPLYPKLGTGDIFFKIGIFINSEVEKIWNNIVLAEKVKEFFTDDAVGNMLKNEEIYWIWGKDAAVLKIRDIVQYKKISFEWNGYNTGYRVRTDITMKTRKRKTLVQIKEYGWENNETGLRGAFVNCNAWSDFLNALKVFTEYGIAYMKR